eukprot:TRINITY_DN2778_c0_g1_i1.p1 TRINITY_DN2778_c0_g1~~TRINITY_DN2778_c0_g1_i1.p1  ORF type:complete len:177 (+),score=49.38 TRINITY_DN2778_c0_g1_i1:52-582(+)
MKAVAIALCVLTLSVIACLADITGQHTDEHNGIEFNLDWTVPATSPDRILFDINVNTLAWIGFGPTSHSMSGADVAIGLPDASTVGEYHITGTSSSAIKPDSHNDIFNGTISQSGGSTKMHFERLFNTGDSSDVQISQDSSTAFVFAYGKSNKLAKHSRAQKIFLNINHPSNAATL